MFSTARHQHRTLRERNADRRREAAYAAGREPVPDYKGRHRAPADAQVVTAAA